MTTENWINVAMIVAVILTAAATLMGPVVAVYLQLRMNQPKTAANPNEARMAKQKNRRRIAKLAGWFFGAAVVFEVSVLTWLMLSPAPLSKSWVLAISLYVALVLFTALAMTLVYVTNKIYERIRLALDVNRVTSQQDKSGRE